MPEEKESILEGKIDNLTKVVYEVKGAVESNDHSQAITALGERHREDVRELHQQHKDHMREEHSSKSSRDNWAVIAAVVCALATAAALFYKG